MRQLSTAFLAVALNMNIGSAFAQSEKAQLARELANPIANLISIPFVTNFDKKMGKGGGHRLYTNIQPLIPIDLNEDWILLSRTIVPIVWKQKNIDLMGNSGIQSGVGDVLQSFFLSPSKSSSAGSLGDFTWGRVRYSWHQRVALTRY